VICNDKDTDGMSYFTAKNQYNTCTMTSEQWRFYTFVTGVAQGVAQDVLGVAPKVFIQITE